MLSVPEPPDDSMIAEKIKGCGAGRRYSRALGDLHELRAKRKAANEILPGRYPDIVREHAGKLLHL